MNDFTSRRPLGRTGLAISRLGVGASYGAPAAAYEAAWDEGVNFFYWGSRRSTAMRDALRHIGQARREELVIAVQSYARLGWLLRRSVEQALRQLRCDRAELLLLGWYNAPPPRRVMDVARDLQRRGLVGHLALSSHRRTLFPTLIDPTVFDTWFVRYNAVHRGAESDVFPSLAGHDCAERPGVVGYTTTRWGHLCDPGRVPNGERTPRGRDCYRFSLSHPDVDAVMCGPANLAQMKEALAALHAGPMSVEEIDWMRRVGDGIYQRDRAAKIRD